MDKPGRESLASLEVSGLVVGLPERPEPPEHLSEAEAKEWRDIVATKPAEWFMRDSQPVLIAYCQAIVMHRDLAARWQEVKNAEKVKDLRLLVVLINQQARLVGELASKLRLTPQSRYTPQSASTASKRADGRKLWQRA